MKDKEKQIKIKRGELVDLLNQEQEELQKAKSIEEMAWIIQNDCNNGSCNNVCEFYNDKTFKKFFDKRLECDNIAKAKTIYNLGYRKLPENSVVLSREEYDEIKIYKSYIPEMKKAFDKVRNAAIKETAEKILKDFKLWAREYQYKDTVVDENGERPMTNNEKLNYLYTYLCDKYKVEIKE